MGVRSRLKKGSGSIHRDGTMFASIGDTPVAQIKHPENVLFVCKLNPVTEEEDLHAIFSQFGTVISADTFRDFKTGDSSCYAFIEFKDTEACNQAYTKMGNALINDGRIHVDFRQYVANLWFKYRRKDQQNGNTTGCFKCGAPGHIAQDCTDRPTANNLKQQPDSKSRYEIVFDDSQWPEFESMFPQVKKSGEQFKEFSAPTETVKQSMERDHELLLGALRLHLCGEKCVQQFDPGGGTFDVVKTAFLRFKVKCKVQKQSNSNSVSVLLFETEDSVVKTDCKTSEVPDADHNYLMLLSSRASQKWEAQYFGPYLILKMIGNVASTLQLHSSSTFHPTCHVSLLKKHDAALPISLDHSISSTYDSTSSMPPKYPAKVLELGSVKRNNAARVQWLIPWDQLPNEEATWEDVQSSMQHYPNFDPWGQGSYKGGSIDAIQSARDGQVAMRRVAQNSLEEILLDGILYAFQEQTSFDTYNMTLNGFVAVVNCLEGRVKPYLPQICDTIELCLDNKSCKVRQKAADAISQIAGVLKQQFMGHLWVVLNEKLAEECPEVLGSTKEALKAINQSGNKFSCS